jgi:hypothetical protein
LHRRGSTRPRPKASQDTALEQRRLRALESLKELHVIQQKQLLAELDD